MKRSTSFIILSLIVFSIINTALTADKPPDIPIYYWGFVTVNGQNASDNTKIEVVVGGNRGSHRCEDK